MVFIIAECGVNFKLVRDAKYMIAEVKRSGADCVKFQIYNHSNLCKAYSSGEVERIPKYDELMGIKIGEAQMKSLKDQADKIGIEIFATPMYLEAVEMLERIGVKRYKIRYADRFNNDLLAAVNATGKPVMISCDMDFVDHLPENWNSDIINMYCIPEYPPTPDKFKQAFQLMPAFFKGYSNHFPSIIPPLMTVSRGAEVIEVHVKLDGTHPIDDAVSIDMTQLTELCRLVREMEEYL